MDRRTDQQPTEEAPAPRGLRVRLVGGVADGRTVVIANPDDVKRVIIPVRDEGGWGQTVYHRVMDKQGLRYVHDND